MTPEEKDIMADMFYFLRDHIHPPAAGTDEGAAFWGRVAREMGETAAAWKNHPLATGTLMAIYDWQGGDRRRAITRLPSASWKRCRRGGSGEKRKTGWELPWQTGWELPWQS